MHSLHKEGSSIIASGKDEGKSLSDVLTKEDIGPAGERFKYFPLLIKLIDAKDNLSVQVHPSDDYALTNENSFGKSEIASFFSTLLIPYNASATEPTIHALVSVSPPINKVFLIASSNELELYIA